MKTKITFWGGLDTIGGNIAEITYGNDRVIFDFGLVYNPANAMLDANRRHAKTHVLDLLKLDAIPAIDGIYSEKALTSGPNYHRETPLAQEQFDLETAVFISHLHLDHMGAMDTIAPAIPVYMTADSKRLFPTLEKIGEGLTIERDYNTIAFQEKITIGKISVTAYQVDHDVIGAASFLIETPDETILYSGDIRMHGGHPEYMAAWLSEMKQRDISMLLIEGTSFQPDAKETQPDPICQLETEIEQAVAKILGEIEGLALFNLYHRNVERIQQFLEAAQTAGRTAVLEPETASIADEFLRDCEFVIYVDHYETLSPALKSLVDQYETVTAEQINQRRENYFVQNSFHHIDRLLDLNLIDSIYMHSNGVPLGPFDPAYDTLQATLAHFQVAYVSLGVSGHASREAILQIIDEIKPKYVVPWHSKHPELVIPMDEAVEVLLPEKGRTYWFGASGVNAY